VSLITNATDTEIMNEDPYPTFVDLLFCNSRLSAHPVRPTYVLLTQSHDQTRHRSAPCYK